MQRLALIRDCAAQAFVLRLGDPTPLGLAMTALYVLASALLLTLALRRSGWGQGERLLWSAVGLGLVALTLNKQLDLQQSVIWTGRCVARAEGWFEQRLVFQRLFGSAMLLLMALGLGWLVWKCRLALAANRVLLVGLVLLSLFVALQIARFEQLAGGLGQVIFQLRLHRILEGVALLTLIWASLRRLVARQNLVP